MNTLKAGFSRVNITPALGTDISGYYIPRKVETILDELEIVGLALACGEDKVVFLSVDNLGIPTDVVTPMRENVAKVTGLPMDAIYIHSTHTHTGPTLMSDAEGELEIEYRQMVHRKMADAAVLALADLQDAKLGSGIGHAPNVAFVRRFRMKDGGVQTNPGVNNPDIVAPIGDVDERVNVIRIDRANDSLVVVNFGNHPDVVGGCQISADWPGFARNTVEQILPNTKCIFFNGAQGDVNHVNVRPNGGDFNGLEEGFDGVSRGYAHSRYIGRVVAAAVLQAFDKVAYTDVDSIRFAKRLVRVPSSRPTAEQIPEAHRINDLHNAGRDDLIPYTGMMLTTVVAEAARMVRLENGPDFFDLPLYAIAIGNLAFIGLPGEPFTGIGRGLKEANGWDMVLPTCSTNCYEGYFPMQDAYDEGGYEARSSQYQAGVAEKLIEEGKALLDSLR